MINSINQPL